MGSRREWFALMAGRQRRPGGSTDGEIKINANENPLGPGLTVVDAMRARFGDVGRYPFNQAFANEPHLIETIAARRGVSADRVVLGVGSQELLRNAVRAWCSPTRPLVTAAPTFESCTSAARALAVPVVDVTVDAAMMLDLDAMLAAARGAGLVFLNNPNNPTATVHGADAIRRFVEGVRRTSPDTVVLIDEAYHDYVTDPSYATAIPLAIATPKVCVARTLSKAYGMAGLRVGYAIGQSDTLAPLARLRMPYSLTVPSVEAAIVALDDPSHIEAERARNTAVRDFTTQAFTEMGATPTASQGNFLFVNIGRPAREFREACAARQVIVGRDFPPFAATHCRISLGTMAEMRRAVAVFRDVLGVAPARRPPGNRQKRAEGRVA